MKKVDWLPERSDLEQVILVYLKYRGKVGAESQEVIGVTADFFGISEQRRSERYENGEKEKIWEANVRASIGKLRDKEKVVRRGMKNYIVGVWQVIEIS